MAEVGILIVDDDAANQRALKNILDSEGWRVRIVQGEAHALAELASGNWSLAIVNAASTNPRGPLFAILKELSLAETPPQGAEGSPRKHFRALFLVPESIARQVLPLLEREGLLYSLMPYHLHDFLGKVSELLVEAGAIGAPIRAISGFGGFGFRKQPRRDPRPSRNNRQTSMFASREDYQMTEEEMAEFERQEQNEKEQRKKHEKSLKDLGRL